MPRTMCAAPSELVTPNNLMARRKSSQREGDFNKRPVRLKNVSSLNEVYDTLHTKSNAVGVCSNQVCRGSMMAVGTRMTLMPRPKAEVLRFAKEFNDQYFASIKRLNSASHHARWEQIQAKVGEKGTYDLTETELVYGAKMAWRNSVRCIGRIQWSKLQVFDARYVATTSGMFEALCNHIKYATNKGNIRSAITIFAQRTDGKHDFRVWNPQLIGYAGYKNEDGSITGDPAQVEFTEVCMKLGWSGKKTRWDILPLVLSANGHDPEYFDIPPELVMEVHLFHPEYKWFADLDYRWYALPAVSNMLFDCGGVEFPGVAFNGWYMSTEIGCRDLCDPHRFNILETVATLMGLDTRNPTSLWKDKALVEVNIAVLCSFQYMNVTIVDHHTASDSFMKFFDNEMKLRGGCPADWVWIVPPMSGSITPVFHQEMAMYNMKPSYDYQDAAWKTHVWKKGRDQSVRSAKKPSRKFHFKEIARAVKFTSKLFGKALSKRIKATILYGTETGKSEACAKKLGDIFGHAFNAQVYSMEEYDIINIEHEALVLVVTSTFGNGDPPENGVVFAQNLYAMKMGENHMCGDDPISMASSRSFIKMNSQSAESQTECQHTKLERTESIRGSVSDVMSENNFGSLSNVRFAVFALGSSAYPNFCAFGKYVDNLLYELGGERILRLTCGDELAGQQQAFKAWAMEVFYVACDTFCLDFDHSAADVTEALKVEPLSPSSVRFMECSPTTAETLVGGLTKMHNKNVQNCRIASRSNLHGSEASRVTLHIILEQGDDGELTYAPGDHVGVFAANRADVVEAILSRLVKSPSCDCPVELQVQKEKSSLKGGTVKLWEPHDKLPTCPLRTLLERFLDVTTPPAPNFLLYLASAAEDPKEKERLEQLGRDPEQYEDWKQWKYPHLAEVLDEFPSVKPDAAALVAQLPPLQPRFYSISSSPMAHPGQIHLTVAVVKYKTQGGEGALHYGICSNYLREIPEGDLLPCYVRNAPGFHLPADVTRPIIMVGPGTGIAPFRSFWQQRDWMIRKKEQPRFGKMFLFFGCRQETLHLYKEETEAMIHAGVLGSVHLALSREPNIPKTYVQDKMKEVAGTLYRYVVDEGGHFYVCGDCTMAECVYQTLKHIVQTLGVMTDTETENYMLSLRDENRYHEDIFGITLRTAEVTNRSRKTARSRLGSNVS